MPSKQPASVVQLFQRKPSAVAEVPIASHSTLPCDTEPADAVSAVDLTGRPKLIVAVATDRYPNVGTAVAATVDAPDMAKENAKMIAKWVRRGLTIERVPVEWVRKHLFTNTPYQPAP